MYLNKALIIGNLTRDPELKSLPSGIQVCSFSMATNHVYRDKDGNKKETAEFHNVVVFGRQAETSAQFLHKGDSALIEGRLQTRSWEQEGQKKYRTEIIADRVQFGEKRTGGASGGGYAGGAQQTSSGPATSSTSKADVIEYPEEEINPEDIPF
ncbi:MAG: single-stranded DNA-binding protein [Candidatus Pacebacteria bacterium]|nr:single-stranded DNA-binding protein [Candidatus Paceibacterota bacterium]